MFAMHTMAVSLFRLLGAIGRSMVVANTLGSFILLFFFILVRCLPLHSSYLPSLRLLEYCLSLPSPQEILVFAMSLEA